jgi:hypothetical protein
LQQISVFYPVNNWMLIWLTDIVDFCWLLTDIVDFCCWNNTILI